MTFKEERQDWRKTFAAQLQKLIDRAGKDSHQVDATAGLSKGTVSSYTTGRYTPTLFTAQKIASALEVSLEELTGARENIGHIVEHGGILSIPRKYIARTGVRRRADLENYNVQIDAPLCNDYPNATCFAVLLEDDAVSLRYPRGGDVLCVDTQSAGIKQIINEKFYVLRLNYDPFFETLVRQAFVRPDGKIEFRLASHLPDTRDFGGIIVLESPSFNPADQVSICGQVYGYQIIEKK